MTKAPAWEKIPISRRDTPENKSPVSAIGMTPNFLPKFPNFSCSPKAGIAMNQSRT